MARRRSRSLKLQKLMLGLLGLLVIASLTYLSYLAFKDQPLGEYIEGEHFELVEKPRRIRGDQIEVMEFFSYACVHCYNLDPDLLDWVEGQGDKVRFVRMPLASSGAWTLLGRTWFTMEALELPERHHLRFFRDIHEGFKQYDSVSSIQAFFEEAGVTADDFTATFNSREVNNKMARADQMARRLKVAAVPTLVVQGKYLVRTTGSVGLNRMLDVASHIVDSLLAGEEPGKVESKAEETESADETMAGDATEAAMDDMADDATEATMSDMAADAAEATMSDMAADASDVAMDDMAADAPDAAMDDRAADAADATMDDRAADAADATMDDRAADAADATMDDRAADAADATMSDMATDAADATMDDMATDEEAK